MIYICEECINNKPCIIENSDEYTTVPINCILKNVTAKWKQTDKYEIVKKQTTPKPEVNYFDSKEEAEDFMKKRVEPELLNQTPNCAICKWIKSDYEYRTYQMDNNHGTVDLEPIGCPTNYDCMAQGGADASDVYNIDQCKSLFEVKPTEVG